MHELLFQEVQFCMIWQFPAHCQKSDGKNRINQWISGKELEINREMIKWKM